MKRNARGYGSDISGTFDCVMFKRPEDGIRRIRIIKEYRPEKYCSGVDVNYFGPLDAGSLKSGEKIRVAQNMLPSGEIHCMVFTKNYVASGSPLTIEQKKNIEKRYTYYEGLSRDPKFWDSGVFVYRPSFAEW